MRGWIFRSMGKTGMSGRTEFTWRKDLQEYIRWVRPGLFHRDGYGEGELAGRTMLELTEGR
jgi:hypothetical protein